MKINVMRVGPIGTNCYLLQDEETKLAALIDPGDQAQDILELVGREGVKVQYILLTHGHYDHTTAVPELKKLLDGVEVYIHKADAQGTGNTIFPLAGQVEDLRCYDEGDHITLGGLDIQVLHTPGHSKGSVTLKVENVLFTGDTLFAGSCGRIDLPGGDWNEMLSSLKRLAGLEGDYQVCPGHEAMSTLEKERKTNPYLMEAMRG